MKLRITLFFLIFFALGGCHSLSPYQSGGAKLGKVGDPDTAYLIGAVGISGSSLAKPEQARLYVRERGKEGFFNVGIFNDWKLKTEFQIQEADGSKATLFAIPLKAGQYELYNVSFHFGQSWIMARETFSVPLELEPGKAYYLGDFRADCKPYPSTRRRYQLAYACRFVRHLALDAQQSLLQRSYPHLPPAVEIDKAMGPAAPFIVDARVLELLRKQLELRKTLESLQ